MLTLPGYQVSEQIYQSSRSRIFRGMRTADHQPVILKLCANDYPDQQAIHRLRHEYHIGASLDDPHLARYLALEPCQHALAIVEEDAGMVSLAQWLPKDGLPLSEFLAIALQLTDALQVLHACHIIHKDICSGNVLIHPETQQVKLIDFSIASQLGRETQAPVTPRLLEGTLTHIAPEQTGRMNRAVDYRADFYALGITFYQMITGQLPFDVSDELELIHCHLSKQPVPPQMIKPALPQALSDLVLKLMEKNASDRYQSVEGLKADLRHCLHELETRGKILPFELVQQDFNTTLQPSQHLYGREQEIQHLLAAFDRVAGGNSELLLVAGYSGIGKTALVQEVHKPMVAKRGLFCAGKFDQFQRNTPYFAWLRALEALMRQLLTESEPKLKVWQAKLKQALGQNAQVLIDVLPELELILGPQPPVAKLGPTEAEQRFHRTFQQLISVFARHEHPLVLFLDDLQWADSASLKLLKLLMIDPERQFLLIIGAYRDNEVDAGHPLLRTLDAIREEKAPVHTLTLTPLQQPALNQLLADTLSTTPDQVTGLGDLVMAKTAGNPFFTNEFLKTLEQEQLLRFDPEQRGWVWDVAEIEQQNITDNVVDLMVAKIRKLPETTQQTLRLGACIGNRFDLETLAIICERPQTQTVVDLWPAIQAGLIQPLEHMNPVIQARNGTYQVPSGAALLNTLYKFLHDRVQQAAHEEIPSEQRQPIHLKIGRLLLKNTASDELGERLFTITQQFNAGADLVETQEERLKLARLNLQAGEKAQASSAYGSAARHFTQGLRLLPDAAWQDHYELWFPLILQGAEAKYLSGHFEQAEQRYRQAVAHTRTALDTIKVFEVQMDQYQLQGRYQEALQIQREGLALLGSPLSDSDQAIQTEIDHEQQTIQRLLGNRRIGELVDAPAMSDPEQIAIIKLLRGAFYSAYLLGDIPLYNLTRIKMVRLSLQYGNAEPSPLGYVSYGSYLCWTRHEYETGYRFGKLAIELADREHNPTIRCRTYHIFASFVSPWTQSLKATQPYFEAAYEIAMASGDWMTLGYISGGMVRNRLYRGEDLAALNQEAQNHYALLIRLRAQIADALSTLLYPIHQLQGAADQDFDEAAFTQKYASVPLVLARVYQANLWLAYLFDDCARWPEFINKLDWMETVLPELWDIVDVSFHVALICLSAYPSASPNDQQAYLQKVESILTKMKRWADHCSANCLHKYCLILAEKARVLNEPLQSAMDGYQQAIASARENGVLHLEALSNELYGKFWLELAQEEYSQLHLRKAYKLYRQWGAQAKVEWLEATYPQFSFQEVESERIPTLVRTSQTTRTQALDWLSLMKAAQVIAGKVTLAELLPTLMKLMAENAGAESGSLILAHEGILQIEALYPEPDASVPLPMAVESSQWLCETAVHYATRTRQPLVLNHVAGNPLFGEDPYVKEHHPRAILCLPLLEQQALVGLLYLEHRTLAEAFTSERLELLKVLSVQAAIALKNARLYDDLSRSESRFRDLIEGSIQGILIHRHYRPLFVNQALAQMLGFTSPEELLALDSFEPLLTDNAKERLQHYQQARERGEAVPREYEIEVLHQNGQVRVLQFLDRAVNWGGQTAVQSTLVDITERKRAEQTVQHLASHDTLTDLPNRALFQDLLQHSLVEAEREQAKAAVLLLDLDNFQAINDSLGQTIGDALLQAVAQRLQEQVQPTDTVARLSGDEFAVLLPHLQQASEADMAALRLRRTLSEPFYIDEHKMDISASLGISLYPDDSEKAEELIRDADLALYKAKSQGRNTYRFYQEGMNLQLQQHKTLAEELRQALHYDKLALHYQPRIDLHREQVTSLEASLRWPRPGAAAVAPAQFLPLAEQAGLGLQLGEWQLQRACRQLRDWRGGPLAELTLTLNLLPSQFQQPDLFEHMKQVLNDSNIEPQRLELGIGEHVLLQDVEIAIDTLARLAGLGIRFTLNDFGAKYSSLGYLKRFPVQQIKLDRSFILDIVRDRDTQDLVQGIIELAHRLKLRTIADGVDDEAQWELLRQANCDLAQGRYYSRALSAEAFEQWLADYRLGLR